MVAGHATRQQTKHVILMDEKARTAGALAPAILLSCGEAQLLTAANRPFLFVIVSDSSLGVSSVAEGLRPQR